MLPHFNTMQATFYGGQQEGPATNNLQAYAPLPVAGNAPPVVGSQNGQAMQNIQAYAPENTQHTQAPPVVGSQNYQAYALHPEITQQNSTKLTLRLLLTLRYMLLLMLPIVCKTAKTLFYLLLLQSACKTASPWLLQLACNTSTRTLLLLPSKIVFQLQRQRFRNNHPHNNMLRSRTLKITMRRWVL